VAARKFIDVKGDLFATASSFSAQAVIKLGSSLILTRILKPEAYGVITILMSIVFVLEMISDIGITIPIIRSKNGEDPQYLNTAWTLRLGRSAINSAILFACAPFIAHLYNAPTLVGPLRVFSIWFIVTGLESMSFPLAIRRKQSRIIVYSELAATFVSSIFTVIYCHFSRDFWGLVYGTLLNRALLVAISYRFYPEVKLKLQVDRAAARELLAFTRFAMPSSILTLTLTQFDKVAFLRLFDLHLLGVYGLAVNITAPVESLIIKISQMVLYPRVAHNFRENQDTFAQKYYTENIKLFASILLVPAAIGGGAELVIAVLYPSRYAQAGAVLQAFMLRASLLALASPAEDLLIAAGEWRVTLVGNVFRAIWTICGSLVGYYLFGFMGFTYGAALNGLPPLIYFLWLQNKKGLLNVRFELYKFLFVIGVAVLAYAARITVFAIWPTIAHRSLP
jgi:lipopolysaccharide exporter